MENGNLKETTLRDYLKVFFRYKAVIVITIITTTLIALAGIKLKTPVYESQVKMRILAERQIEASYYRQLGDYRNVETALTQSEMVKVNPVIERAVNVLKLYERPLDYEKKFSSPIKRWLIDLRLKSLNAKIAAFPPQKKEKFLFRKAVDDLKKKITAQPVRDTDLFSITVKDFDAEAAAEIANVVSRSYCIFDLEQQLAEMMLKYGKEHATVKQIKAALDEMTANLNGKLLSDIEAVGPAGVKIIEQAVVPLKPAGIPSIVILLIALFLSGLCGIMLAFVFDYTDQTFKSPQEIENFLGLPAIGSVVFEKKSRDRLLFKLAKKRADYLQCYQKLCEQIRLLMRNKNLKSILLTSILPREGCTTVTANLGIYFSQKLGYKTLIVDGNFRTSAMHAIFKVPSVPGLAEVIKNEISFADAVKSIDADLTLLTAGNTAAFNPAAFLDSYKFRNIVNAAKEKYEIVLIDSAPLSDFKDAAVISFCADGVILIVSEGAVRKQVFKNAIVPLEQEKTNVLGVVLNKRIFHIPDIIYKNI